MATGIIPIDKPQDWTSQDVAARLRRVFGTRRIGHGGTLDPMATGVLPVFVGRATRAVEFFEHADKRYEATLRLGLLTDTEDIWGQILEQRPVSLTREALLAVLPRFVGELQQIPPMYSAIKVEGRKLYDLARSGREVERAPRKITVFSLELLAFDGTDARLAIHCSKGTYIRTLCKDIGLALGCGGCMAALRRVSAGAYAIADAIPLEALLTASQEGCEMQRYLQPVDSLFQDRPAITLTANQEKRCRNGNAFTLKTAPGEYRVYSASGEFLMLGKVQGQIMTTCKSFFEV